MQKILFVIGSANIGGAEMGMFEIINELKQCKNPYSCPHGRPIVWEL